MFRECLGAFIILMGLVSSKGSITAYKISGTESTGMKVNLGNNFLLKGGKEKSLNS